MKGYDELPIIAKDFGGAVSITKTPTKEQIEKIYKVWGNTFGREWDITPIEDLIKVTVTEWEKIRNSPN